MCININVWGRPKEIPAPKRSTKYNKQAEQDMLTMWIICFSLANIIFYIEKILFFILNFDWIE